MAKKKKSQRSPGDVSKSPADATDATELRETEIAASNSWKSVPTLLQRRGGEANPKVSLQEANTERKLVALADMQKGEMVFKIPRHLWFTAACLNSHEAGRAVLKWTKAQDDDDAELCMLAILLLLERRAKANSRWSDYIAALPWSAALPLTWTPEELSVLGGASPLWHIEIKQKQLEKVYASLLTFVKGNVLAELKDACPSSKEFILAFSLAHSRAMGIPSVDGDGRRWHLAMLPFADMLNHSCTPEVDWDIVEAPTKDGSRYVAAHTLSEIPEGSELRISYKRAGSAQGFFATYGFVEEAQEVQCTELRLEPWDGPGLGSIVHVCSTQSLRQLLSRFREKAASAEERKNLGKRPEELAARFPLSQKCEVGALEECLRCVRKRLEYCAKSPSHSVEAVKRLQQADLAGWKRLENFISCLLDAVKAQPDMSAARLAVLVHAHMRAMAAGLTPSEPKTFVSDKLVVYDEGGERGRGYFASRSISPGEVLLREEPHIFDAEEDDFSALATLHVLAAAEEGFELRTSGEDSLDEEAFRWLAGVPGCSKDKVAHALAAAQNNGFETSIPDGVEVEATLLFKRLSIFNHSCWPNCAVYRQRSSGLSHVLATGSIEKGAELTIHYSDELILLPKELRRTFLTGRFGFFCECDRCQEPFQMHGAGEALEAAFAHLAEDQNFKVQAEAAKVEALLQERVEGPQEDVRADNMKRAHAGLCKMRRDNGQPSGFVYKDFNRWEDALAAVEAAMPHLSAFAGPTHWARHHARGLQTLALEELQKDSRAYFVLAEHAAAAWKIMPRYCDALRLLQQRLQKVRDRLPDGLKDRLQEKVAELHGDSLQGLDRDVATLTEWLQQAGALGSTAAEVE